MSEVEITLKFDVNNLRSYDDAYLAALWHVAQWNPAPYDDRQAGELVQQIGWEIVRRWLAGVQPEMYHHKPESYFWHQLARFAKYEPGGHAFTPEWDKGEWRLRDELRGSGAVGREGDDPKAGS